MPLPSLGWRIPRRHSRSSWLRCVPRATDRTRSPQAAAGTRPKGYRSAARSRGRWSGQTRATATTWRRIASGSGCDGAWRQTRQPSRPAVVSPRRRRPSPSIGDLKAPEAVSPLEPSKFRGGLGRGAGLIPALRRAPGAFRGSGLPTDGRQGPKRASGLPRVTAGQRPKCRRGRPCGRPLPSCAAASRLEARSTPSTVLCSSRPLGSSRQGSRQPLPKAPCLGGLPLPLTFRRSSKREILE